MRLRAMGVFVSCVAATTSSTMASLRARNLLLLENIALKFDLCGVEKRNEHDIFQNWYQLKEISSPP